jgi:hypothetical protein
MFSSGHELSTLAMWPLSCIVIKSPLSKNTLKRIENPTNKYDLRIRIKYTMK